MDKRTIRLNDYDTAAHGLWTLTAWDFPEPTPEENLMNVPGRRQGPLNLSTVLTDGEPSYGSRPLSITLESSEGDRPARLARISEMVNRFHGRQAKIVLPDHPMHYAVGSLSVQLLYNDLVHASVQVTGTCEPWLYAKDETAVLLTATASDQNATLRNAGAMAVVPLIEVSAETDQSVNLVYGSYSWALSAGAYKLPDLLLTPGDHVITYSGTGTVSITYREAIIR